MSVLLAALLVGVIGTVACAVGIATTVLPFSAAVTMAERRNVSTFWWGAGAVLVALLTAGLLALGVKHHLAWVGLLPLGAGWVLPAVLLRVDRVEPDGPGAFAHV